MNECFRCGVSGEKVKLSNAISNKGIVKICDNCASLEKLPIIRKPTNDQITESKSQKQQSVRDRLTEMNRSRLLAGREVTLRELVDKNLKAKQIQPHPDLADNFHWTIQRIRRNRKITREQFAKGISETEATVRMIEQGFLPENNYKIINKIESYLRINLRKSGTSGFPDIKLAEERKFTLDNSILSKEEQAKKLSFDMDTARRLKVSDLKEMKKQQEETEKPIDSWEEEYSEDDEKFLDKQDEEEDFFDEEDI